MGNDTMERYLGMFLDNRYELLEMIGNGGMAVIFKAMCHRLNRFVAVKIMRPELAVNEKFRARFQSESQAIAMLSHHNIVSVYDVSHSDDIEYIVMELIEGITLKDYLKDRGSLNPKQALNISIQIAKALSHAHSKGIVHRDIKPQNIMILSDGTVKVADFGIANLQSEVPDVENEAIGSVRYISPEQVRGLPADGRSDIYSLGIVMYEMLTGQLPFDGDDDRTIALKHLSAVPTPIQELKRDVPQELSAITMKAMSSSLEDRYQTADEMLDALESFRKSVSTAFERSDGNVVPISSDGELTREGYVRRRRRSKRVSMLSGLFGVMAFILILAVFFWNYWLKDIFAVNQRITIPNFVGSSYDSIVNSKDFTGSFNFELTYEIDPDVETGVIISQSPAAGKSYMLTEDGVNVKLAISTGIMLTDIPNVVDRTYRDAVAELEKLGFQVETIYASSETVAEDLVLSISPSAGEKLPAGATVYITISTGPESKTVIMPYLIGGTREEAEEKIASLYLTLVSVSEVYNDTIPTGCVVSQNVEAGTEIAVGSKIYLQVSLGPETTPTPVPTATPAPTPEQG